METIKNELIPVLKKVVKELTTTASEWANRTFTPQNVQKARRFVTQNKKLLLGLAAAFVMYSFIFGGSSGRISKEVPSKVATKARKFGATERGARKLVQEFAAPGADFWEFTQMIKPTRADYRAYFKKSVADELYEAYEQDIWNGRYSGQGLHRQPAENYVILRFSNTTKLKKGKKDGFEADLTKLADYIKNDIPYCEFRVVLQGKRKGTYYNNMVYVNGRWVIFPNLWGVMKDLGHIE